MMCEIVPESTSWNIVMVQRRLFSASVHLPLWGVVIKESSVNADRPDLLIRSVPRYGVEPPPNHERSTPEPTTFLVGFMWFGDPEVIAIPELYAEDRAEHVIATMVSVTWGEFLGRISEPMRHEVYESFLDLGRDMILDAPFDFEKLPGMSDACWPDFYATALERFLPDWWRHPHRIDEYNWLHPAATRPLIEALFADGHTVKLDVERVATAYSFEPVTPKEVARLEAEFEKEIRIAEETIAQGLPSG